MKTLTMAELRLHSASSKLVRSFARTLRNITVLAAVLSSLSSCADDRLTLTGTITGLPEDCRIRLRNFDQDISQDSLPVCTNILGTEHFTLNAVLDGPTLLRLEVTKYNAAYGEQAPVASLTFMADNEKVTLPSVAYADFVKYTDEETAEEHIPVEGGRVQREYREYLDAQKGLRKKFAQLMAEGGGKLMDAMFGIISEDDDSVKMYIERFEKIRAEMNNKESEFILQHPDYAISALLVSRDLNAEYRYTTEQIDSLVALIADNSDSHRLEIVKRNAAKAKKKAIGMPLGNEAVTLADGTTCRLQELLNNGGLTLIDCWASWCGPCRKAITKLKEMNSKYAGELKIVSISCDRTEADWRKALAEEGMTWTQAILDTAQLEPFITAYDISTIPRLMLIRDGRIILSTSDPSEIERRVAAYK
ncbi:MAG: thioredoxin family protein [Prevotella sp.]|nr:thioredoxin family protein [Prevotella sp.]